MAEEWEIDSHSKQYYINKSRFIFYKSNENLIFDKSNQNWSDVRIEQIGHRQHVCVNFGRSIILGLIKNHSENVFLAQNLEAANQISGNKMPDWLETSEDLEKSWNEILKIILSLLYTFKV
jgi:hypothetical protein